MGSDSRAADPDPSRGNTRAKPWYRTFSGWKVRLEAFAIPFVMLYAVVSYLQWRDLRGNFELNERAWIATETVTAQPASLRAGDAGLINVSFRNSGRTPAKDLLVTLAVETIERGKAPSFSYPGSDRARFGLLPPNGSTSMQIRASGGTSPAAVLYVHGHVLYEDIFKQYHWTTFCYSMGAPRERSPSFGYCPEHNDAGDGENPRFKPELPPSVWR